MTVLRLLAASLINRRLSVGLSLLALALSVALFLSVVRIQQAAKASFEASVSGVDLIVAARGGDLPILLSAVFRLGNPTRNISWDSYQQANKQRAVAWSVPIALGDSHRGYRVVGTSSAYFDHLKTADRQALSFASGRPFEDLFDVVLGANVAKEFGYDLGSRLILSHGTGSVGAAEHDTLPFVAAGILAPTGTPTDQALFVSLEAIEAIHVGWESGRQLKESVADTLRARDNQPKAITAAFVGLKSRVRLFQAQRAINNYPSEPLSAVAPGLALAQLWNLIGTADRALRLITGLIVFVAIIGLVSTTIAGLSARRREMAIFRALGASPVKISSFLFAEAIAVAIAAALLGWLLVQAVSLLAVELVANRFGLILQPQLLTGTEALFLLAIVIAAGLAALIPALQLYRHSLHDGMTIKQ